MVKNDQTQMLDKALNALMAICLSLMGIFIFANVFLRYAFNSGLTWAEELSRFLFVWLVFLGAIGAMKDNSHLGFTSLVQKLPIILKKIVFVVSNGIVLFCIWVIFQGSVQMTMMTTHTLSPATGLPLSYMYGIGIIMGIGMFATVFHKLYRALFVKGAIDTLVILKESEDDRDFSSSAAAPTGGNKP
jgi:TRAP-type C4-dicarboxylate transport system permease small subunit